MKHLWILLTAGLLASQPAISQMFDDGYFPPRQERSVLTGYYHCVTGPMRGTFLEFTGHSRWGDSFKIIQNGGWIGLVCTYEVIRGYINVTSGPSNFPQIRVISTDSLIVDNHLLDSSSYGRVYDGSLFVHLQR